MPLFLVCVLFQCDLLMNMIAIHCFSEIKRLFIRFSVFLKFSYQCHSYQFRHSFLICLVYDATIRLRQNFSISYSELPFRSLKYVPIFGFLAQNLVPTQHLSIALQHSHYINFDL